MDAVYSITDLAKQQSTVKQAAQQGVVRITEHGRGAYVFCSERVFEDRIAQAVEEALFEERMSQLIEQGMDDIAAGRCYRGTDAAREEIERRVAAHA